MDRTVNENEVHAAGVHVPVVLNMRLWIVGGSQTVFQPGRFEYLSPVLLGRRIELVVPPCVSLFSFETLRPAVPWASGA